MATIKKFTPNPNPQETPDMVEKFADPSQVLAFHADPNGKYMAHFHHFAIDTPTRTVTSKGGKDKVSYECKQPTLRLADVDAIIKKHDELIKAGRKSTLENAALNILGLDLLNSLEKAKLDLEPVIEWARADATAKLGEREKAPKAAKAGVDAVVGELAKIMVGMQPETLNQAEYLDPDMLKEKLRTLVNDDVLMEKAVLHLGGCMAANGRIKGTGAIRLRAEKDPAKVAANKAAKSAKALAK